jgi:hypothetical protein
VKAVAPAESRSYWRLSIRFVVLFIFSLLFVAGINCEEIGVFSLNDNHSGINYKQHDVVRLCEYNDEVGEHLIDALEHSAEATGAMVETAAAAAAGQPVLGVTGAVVAGKCASEACQDIYEAYNAYNNDACRQADEQ